VSTEDRIARAWAQCLAYRNGDRVQASKFFSAALDIAAQMQRDGKPVAR
jgi:hypothetical protein